MEYARASAANDMLAAHILIVTLQKKVSRYEKHHGTAHEPLALELNLDEFISIMEIIASITLLTTFMVQLMGDFA